MASIGMNVSADGRHTAASLRALNCTWVRITHRRDFDVSARLAEYRDHGISVLLCFDRTSVEAYPSAAIAFEGALDDYGAYVTLWEIGNEPDQDSPSSWTMPAADFVALGQTARSTLPGRLIVAGGLVSGQPDYLVGQDISWCDAIAIHPYLKDATPNNDLPDVDVLIRQYMALGKPIIVSEWGWWGDDEQRGRQEIDDMIGWAAKSTLIPLFCYFSMDDAMVPPFGLYRADGTAKSAVSAFTAQARTAVSVPLPSPAPPAPTPAPSPAPTPNPEPAPLPALAPLDQAYAALWRAAVPDLALNPDAAFFRAWQANPDAMGSPVSAEIPDADGSVLQSFTRGIWRWREGNDLEKVA